MIPLFKVAMAPEASAHVAEVLASGYVGEGPKCRQLEEELCKTLGRERLLLVNSGTSALQLALHLAGARPGTEVVTTPQTCLATSAAIAATGAQIVWADIDPETGNISVESVVDRVGPLTRAVVGVDWGGRLCNFAGLRAALPGIPLVEDAAHAFGAGSDVGPPAREHGDYVCYSFQAIKHFTTGDGGALVAPSAALHERARLLRWFGLDRTQGDAMRCYQSVAEVGWKYQSNDIAAAIGLANLPGALDRVEACRANAVEYYNRILCPGIGLPPSDSTSSWWIYTIRVSNPQRFVAFAAERGIVAGQVHVRNDRYPCFSGARSGRLLGVDEFSAHQVNIPVGWWLTAEDREAVARVVEEWSRSPHAR